MELLARNQTLKWFGLVFLVFLLLYHKSIQSLYDYWTKEDYSHGFLLLAISVYIFYRLLKEKQRSFVSSPSTFWLSILFLMTVVWFATRVTYVEKLELISLPLIIIAAMLALLGTNNGKKFLLPVVLMLFSTPVFELGNLFLQKATALLSGVGLDIIGVGVLVEGLLIQVPAGDFIVDSGCSGVRVLTVGASLSLIYSYMHRMAAVGAFAVVVAGMIASFAANIIRVMIIVYVGNETNMRHALVSDHGDLGWIVFAVVISIYFIILNWILPKIKNPLYGTKIFQPDPSEEHAENEKNSKKAAIYSVVTIVIFSVGPFMEYRVSKQEAKTRLTETLPETIGGWSAVYGLRDVWQPEYEAGIPDITESKIYSNGVSNINLTVLFFNRQSSENEAINITNRPYDRKFWTPVHIERFTLTEAVGDFKVVEEILVRHKGADKIVWRWYEVNGVWTSSDKAAKIYNLIGLLKNKPEITVFMLASDVTTTQNVARLNLQNILSEYYSSTKMNLKKSLQTSTSVY